MKKQKIAICLICGFFILINIPSAWNLWFVQTENDIEKYISNEYINYNYGEIAKKFFEEYVCLDEYIDADFHYCDGEKRIVFGYNRQFVKSMFVLDVYYEEDVFTSVLNDLIDNKQFVYLDQRSPKTGCGFEEYCLVNDMLKQSNSAASIFVDSNNKTIRYAFVYDETCGNSIAYDIAITLNIPENSNENDLIFDYSENTAIQ